MHDRRQLTGRRELATAALGVITWPVAGGLIGGAAGLVFGTLFGAVHGLIHLELWRFGFSAGYFARFKGISPSVPHEAGAHPEVIGDTFVLSGRIVIRVTGDGARHTEWSVNEMGSAG